jgi:spore germination protein YaaH
MLTEKNNTVYLPINDLDILYDLEIEYSEEYNRAIFSSTTEEKKQSITLKNAYVYEKPSKFSKKIEKLEMSEYVIVLGTEKKYKKIRTPNGNIGYIKESKISDEETKREKMVETAIDVNIVKDANDTSKTYDSSILSTEKQNVVMPVFFTLDSNSKVLDKTNNKSSNFTNYISWVNENNIQIWATCTNSDIISEDLLTYYQRNTVINDIYQKLMTYQFQGVNINFEKIDDVNSFYRFLIELKPKLKESGLKLAVTYNKSLDKNKISKIADLVIDE